MSQHSGGQMKYKEVKQTVKDSTMHFKTGLWKNGMNSEPQWSKNVKMMIVSFVFQKHPFPVSYPKM